MGNFSTFNFNEKECKKVYIDIVEYEHMKFCRLISLFFFFGQLKEDSISVVHKITARKLPSVEIQMDRFILNVFTCYHLATS